MATIHLAIHFLGKSSIWVLSKCEVDDTVSEAIDKQFGDLFNWYSDAKSPNLYTLEYNDGNRELIYILDKTKITYLEFSRSKRILKR